MNINSVPKDGGTRDCGVLGHFFVVFNKFLATNGWMNHIANLAQKQRIMDGLLFFLL